jgi:hypothetical protein
VRGTGSICPPANQAYFDAFNGAIHPTNYNGQTVKMKAEADAEDADALADADEDNDITNYDNDYAADDKSVFTTATSAPAWTKPKTTPNPNPSDASMADMLHSSSLDRETKINHMNDALLAVFPAVEGDKVTFIGSTFLRYGEERPYLNHCLALGTCDPVPGAQIVSCKTERKLLQAGANRVVLPAHIGADRIAHLILHPNARELLGSTTQAGVAFEHHLTELGLDMEEIEIGPSSRWINRPVGDVELAAAGRLMAVAILRAEGGTEINPATNAILNPGDALVVLRRGARA